MDETASLPHSSCPTAPSRAVRTSKPCARPRAVFAADPPALVVNSPTRMRSRCRSSGPTRTLPPVSPSRDLKNESATLALWSMTARGCSATTSGGRFSSPPASRLRLRCGKRGDGTGRMTGVRYDSCVALGRFREPASTGHRGSGRGITLADALLDAGSLIGVTFGVTRSSSMSNLNRTSAPRPRERKPWPIVEQV